MCMYVCVRESLYHLSLGNVDPCTEFKIKFKLVSFHSSKSSCTQDQSPTVYVYIISNVSQ